MTPALRPSGAPLGGPRVAGEQVEDAGGVGAEVVLGGEEREVRVDAGGEGIVVAGSEVHVALEAARLAPDHQRDLAVGLVADQAVDDVHAALLQRPRPEDVGLLVHARFELD